MLNLRKAPALVSPAWLAANRGPSVKVVDASWYLPAMGRDARQEFEACRIPGAVFFDVDATDVASPLPHMLPSDAFFSRTMSELGIVHDDHVVCYDGKGLFSAARFWWMLRAYGHPAASVLDGGLPAWQRAGHATESGPRAPVARASPPFEARLDASLVADLAKVRSLVDAFQSGAAPAQTLVDARSQARFEGVAKEARAGCRSGHAPGSRSVPFDRVLQADGTMRPPEQVAAVFAEAGVPGVDAPLVGDLG